MLEKIVKRKWYLRKHLDAPMLKEREDFLEMLSQQGKSHSYLLQIADYLLLVVVLLKMTDENRRKIMIAEIDAAASLWSNTIRNHPMKRKPTTHSKTKFMDIAYTWLSYVGLLDDLYTNKELIINRLFNRKAHKLRYLTYPMMDERVVHLRKWEEAGATVNTLRQIAAYQLHAIDLLHLEDRRMVTKKEVCDAADVWMHTAKSGKESTGIYARKRFLSHVTDWLETMGRYVQPEDEFPQKDCVNEYLHWLRDAKGYSPATISARYSVLKNFMQNTKPASMQTIIPQQLDNYITIRNDEGCSRKTIASISSVLRDFFTYGHAKGWNSAILAPSLKSPRIYGHEDIPSFVPWDVLQRILSDKKDASGIAIRDYAVLLLLSVYGLRCSEVTDLLLSDIDWHNERLFLRRAKGCRPQMMPLLPTVGNAIVRYIRELRYNGSPCKSLFIGKRAPHAKLSNSAIYRMVNETLKTYGVRLRHNGPHSLRHGCATHLINTGYSLKEIADLLGHMRLDTTRIYAKVDMQALREVADMDWEGLL